MTDFGPTATRADHLAACKERALEYLNHGDLKNAAASMASDLAKHPETAPSARLTMLVLLDLQNGDREGVRRWIEGFN